MCVWLIYAKAKEETFYVSGQGHYLKKRICEVMEISQGCQTLPSRGGSELNAMSPGTPTLALHSLEMRREVRQLSLADETETKSLALLHACE